MANAVARGVVVRFEHGVDELNHWASILLQKMQGLPQLADVASDQQSAGPTLKVEINRDVASRLGVDPALVDSILYGPSPMPRHSATRPARDRKVGKRDSGNFWQNERRARPSRSRFRG